MIRTLTLIVLLLAGTPLTGQSGKGQPVDSTRTTIGIVPAAVFPVWTAQGTGLTGTAPDSLLPALPHLKPATRPLLRFQRRVGLGMIVLFGASAYHYHIRSEAAYRDYLTSGDPAELEALFRRTEDLDRLSGWTYLGAEMGLFLVAFSFVLEP